MVRLTKLTPPSPPNHTLVINSEIDELLTALDAENIKKPHRRSIAKALAQVVAATAAAAEAAAAP